MIHVFGRCLPHLAIIISLLPCCTSSGPISGDLPPIKNPEKQVQSTIPSDKFVPGDNLELFVKEDSTLNSSYPVRDGGYIVIPRVGRIQVAGLTRPAAEKLVKESLKKTQLTEATVLVERTSKNALLSGSPGASISVPKLLVYVTGAVLHPGTHYVPVTEGRSLGVYETILITGGLARLAQDQKVEVMRVDSAGRRHRAMFDLRKVRDGASPDPPVGAGDIIHVPEKVFGF